MDCRGQLDGTRGPTHEFKTGHVVEEPRRQLREDERHVHTTSRSTPPRWDNALGRSGAHAELSLASLGRFLAKAGSGVKMFGALRAYAEPRQLTKHAEAPHADVRLASAPQRRFICSSHTWHVQLDSMLD